ELLVEEPDSPAEDLVAVVSAERALFRLRVVLLADFGHPEQLIVVEKVAREHDDVRRLEELLAAPCIDEAYARHLAVVIFILHHLDGVGMRTPLETPRLAGRRDDGHFRR